MHRSLVGLTVATALLFAASSAGLAVRLAGSEHSTPSAGETCQRSGAASPGQAKAILACLSPSLAFIRTPTGTGSGVLVDGRFVVTNAHVVDPFAAVTVVLGGRERHEGVPVKGVDLAADLALVGPVDTRRPTLPLADHAPLEQGDDLFLVGYPGEADEAPDATISRGILSRTRRAEEQRLTFLQTDASIGGGQSGGALVDEEAHVVGVSGFSFAEAFALALSGPDTRRSIGRILAGEVPPYRPFPEGSGSTSGRFRLADKDSVQVLTLKTGVERQPVRLTLPAEAQPALLVTDLDGSDAYFKNQEALDAIAELAEEGEQPQQAGIEPDLAVAPGVFEFEVPRDTYAVITVGTRRPAGAEMAFASSVPLGRYDDGDEDRALRVGERVEGAIDGLEAGGDTYLVELQRGEVVEIFAGSATGDVGYAVRPPGQQGSEAILVDDSDVGLYGTDAKDNYEAQASGVHRLTVFSSDGRATGYVLRVRRS